MCSNNSHTLPYSVIQTHKDPVVAVHDPHSIAGPNSASVLPLLYLSSNGLCLCLSRRRLQSRWRSWRKGPVILPLLVHARSLGEALPISYSKLLHYWMCLTTYREMDYAETSCPYHIIMSLVLPPHFFPSCVDTQHTTLALFAPSNQTCGGPSYNISPPRHCPVRNSRLSFHPFPRYTRYIRLV